jgi:ribosome maturation factor RimP
MVTEERVRQIIDEVLAGSDRFLVDLKVNPGNIIVVEIDNDDAIKVSELAEVNRTIRERLGVVGEDVELRVSSPGTSKPFRVPRQYLKHIGKMVEVETNDGRKMVGVMEKWDGSKMDLRVQIPSKVKGRPAKLEKDVTVFSCDELKAIKATVTFK